MLDFESKSRELYSLAKSFDTNGRSNWNWNIDNRNRLLLLDKLVFDYTKQKSTVSSDTDLYHGS